MIDHAARPQKGNDMTRTHKQSPAIALTHADVGMDGRLIGARFDGGRVCIERDYWGTPIGYRAELTGRAIIGWHPRDPRIAASAALKQKG